MFAHECLEVGPHGVGALGEHAVALVQHLVENLDPLVGQPDLVGVRIAQRPPDVSGVPVLDHGANLAADVLDRLAHARQERLESREYRFDRHQTRVSERAVATPPRDGSAATGLNPVQSKTLWRRWTDWSRPMAIMSAKMAE